MATKIPTVTKIPFLVAAPPAPPVEAEREGFIKVRLTFLTSAPKHVRNLQLRTEYGIKPPYNEDVCILFPAARTFNDFETYLDTFESLKLSGIVHADDILLDATLLIEDDLTLAHVIES